MTDHHEPRMLAGADQELAQLTDVLNQLITTWHHEQPRYDACNFDHLARIAVFMITHIRPQLNYSGAVATLALATHRLAKQQERQ